MKTDDISQIIAIVAGMNVSIDEAIVMVAAANNYGRPSNVIWGTPWGRKSKEAVQFGAL